MFEFFKLSGIYFWDRALLCSPHWPETHHVEEAGLEFIDWPASAAWVLGFKVCALFLKKNCFQLWLDDSMGCSLRVTVALMTYRDQKQLGQDP